MDATVIGTGFDAPELTTLRAVRLVSDPDGGEPLRDRIAADLVLAELGARGVVEDPSAGVELFVHGYVVEQEHWVPPQTRFSHYSRPWPVRRYCTADGRWITVYAHGGWPTETWTIPGYTVREYSHRAEVALQAPGGKVLWMGELRADGRTNDFARVMRACIPLLFGEYPVPSGQPAERRVRLADPDPPQ